MMGLRPFDLDRIRAAKLRVFQQKKKKAPEKTAAEVKITSFFSSGGIPFAIGTSLSVD